jgi:hypothetical protein
MAEAVALRQALAAYLGDMRFRKFVHQGLRSGRLRYWQEQEWVRFTAAHPEFAVGMEELEVALRICELHGQELLPDTVEVFRGCMDYADWYIAARNSLFPHAASGPVSTEGAPFEGGRARVWYCPACRQAEVEWQATRRT